MDLEHDRQSVMTKTSFNWSDRFSEIAQRTAPPQISWLMAQALETPGLISLAAGFVDQKSLPHKQIAEVMRQMLLDPHSGQAALQYGTTQGDLDLRTLLVDHLREEDAFHPDAQISPEHCIIGSGSQQILYLAAEALLNQDDIVLMEAPTYFVVLGVFQSRGARTVGIDTDKYGLVPEKLEQCLETLKIAGQLSRIKMLYLMSYSTNPLGVTLTQERRKAIFSILQRYKDDGFPILLVEDAAYKRLVFDDDSPVPIKSDDEDNDQILYTESFSKSLSPGFRLGFGIGPKSLIDKMTDLKGNHDFGSGNFAQHALKSVIQSGLFDRHLDIIKQIYHQKRDAALETLKQHFPADARILHPNGGLYIWITLPDHLDTGPQGEIFKAALEEKVLYVPGCLCYSPDRPESRRSSSIRLSYGMIDQEPLREACIRLGKALQRFVG